MQHAVLNVRQDLQQMLDRRLRIDPTVTPFDEGLKIFISVATDILQAAAASENYYLLDAEIGRVTERIQKMAVAMRKAAILRDRIELASILETKSSAGAG
jgi:hypothetical protein